MGSSGARIVVSRLTRHPPLAGTIAAALPPERNSSTRRTRRRTRSKRRSADRPPRENEPGETRILVTDASDRLRRVAGHLLSRPAAELTLVGLPM
ncbi:MAG: hypothetical protein IPL89_16175 [Acidobacteria bacterium]|nr:hypothetical protein [Acidobacteriota bacterium]